MKPRILALTLILLLIMAVLLACDNTTSTSGGTTSADEQSVGSNTLGTTPNNETSSISEVSDAQSETVTAETVPLYGWKPSVRMIALDQIDYGAEQTSLNLIYRGRKT